MTIRDRLQHRLTEAMKARDRLGISVYRAALSAIANAEAVPVDTMAPAGAIETARLGVGSADAPRRVLTDVDQQRVISAEIAELMDAAAHLPDDRAQPLLQSAALLEAVLSQ